MQEDEQKLLSYYKQAMRIDRNNLDAEVANQAAQHQVICERHVVAKSRLREAKDRAKHCLAERRKHWREVLRSEQEGRVTLAEIDSYVESDAIYLKQLQAVHDQELVFDQWEGLRETSSQRSFMFKELTALFVHGYHSTDGVKAPKMVDPVERMEARQQQHRDYIEKRKKKKEAIKRERVT